MITRPARVIRDVLFLDMTLPANGQKHTGDIQPSHLPGLLCGDCDSLLVRSVYHGTGDIRGCSSSSRSAHGQRPLRKRLSEQSESDIAHAICSQNAIG